MVTLFMEAIGSSFILFLSLPNACCAFFLSTAISFTAALYESVVNRFCTTFFGDSPEDVGVDALLVLPLIVCSRMGSCCSFRVWYHAVATKDGSRAARGTMSVVASVPVPYTRMSKPYSMTSTTGSFDLSGRLSNQGYVYCRLQQPALNVELASSMSTATLMVRVQVASTTVLDNGPHPYLACITHVSYWWLAHVGCVDNYEGGCAAFAICNQLQVCHSRVSISTGAVEITGVRHADASKASNRQFLSRVHTTMLMVDWCMNASVARAALRRAIPTASPGDTFTVGGGSQGALM